MKKKKLKCEKNDDVPFELNWTADSFVIEFIEGRGGEDGGDGYLLSIGARQIEYFKTLARAKMVAQLIYEG